MTDLPICTDTSIPYEVRVRMACIDRAMVLSGNSWSCMEEARKMAAFALDMEPQPVDITVDDVAEFVLAVNNQPIRVGA